MVVFPNCKINIGLYITGKRPDGFHNLETVFYPLSFVDALEIIDNKIEPENNVVFSSTGLQIDGEPEKNLCIKAYHLFKKDFPDLPSVKIHLHKNIPIGAGLGGGSANAAFTLQLLNEKFNLGLSIDQLINYAAHLGSDCPFFIINKPCYATGRGEALKEISLDLSAYKILLINPGIHINTGRAFAQLNLSEKVNHHGSPILKEISCLPIENWRDNIHNDFEHPIFSEYPEVAGIKNELYLKGALYASMSGSGSSVYGIFDAKSKVELNFPPQYFSRWV